MRVYLIGYTGCGKSTVGQALASAKGWPFVDVGDISDRLSKKAGTHYDCCNRALMEGVMELSDVVVATGGYDARALARSEKTGAGVGRGRIVWIDTPFDVIWERLSRDGWGIRKKMPTEAFRNGFEIMRGSFEAAADAIVPGDGAIWAVRAAIEDVLAELL